MIKNMQKEWKVSLIKQFFENIKYGSYSQNARFDNLSIEYKQSLFTKRPIDVLTNNSVEILKVNSIKLFLDNKICKRNNQNANFYDLPFDGD